MNTLGLSHRTNIICIDPCIFFLFLNTCPEVSSPSNTTRLQDPNQDFTQLDAKAQEVLSTPGVECWPLSASQEQKYSCAELLNITFLSFVGSPQPCCFVYIN